MDWKPYNGVDDAQHVVAWALPALQALADAMARLRRQQPYGFQVPEMRGQHSLGLANRRHWPTQQQAQR